MTGLITYVTSNVIIITAAMTPTCSSKLPRRCVASR